MTDSPSVLVGKVFGIAASVHAGILTKGEGQNYDEYLYYVKSNELAKRVKIADILSNLADDPTDKQIVKYAKALTYLMS